MSKTLYLLRHGDLDLQGVKRFVGQSEWPLSPKGIDQAHRWRSYFAEIPLDGIFSSPLERAKQTAQLIAGPNREFQIVENLREIALGEWDGLPVEEVIARQPEEYRKRGEDLASYRPPGGESFQDCAERVLPALHQVLTATEGQSLIVAHAGVNRIIFSHCLGLPLRDLFRLGMDYGSLAILGWKNEQWTIKSWGIPCP